MAGPEVELCPGRRVGPAHPVFVIAEIGQNHQGDSTIARQLITAAARAGANCVKLQKSSLPDKFTAGALAQPYSGPHSWGATYGEHKAHLELSEQQYRDLQCHAREEGIAFTASAMDSVSAAFLHQLDVPFIKVGSGDANNLPLMREIAERGRPMVVSTGMCGMGWVRTLHSSLSRLAAPLVPLTQACWPPELRKPRPRPPQPQPFKRLAPAVLLSLAEVRSSTWSWPFERLTPAVLLSLAEVRGRGASS